MILSSCTRNAGFQRQRQLVQFRGQGDVDLDRTHTNGHAANDRRIDLHVELDALAVLGLKVFKKPRFLLSRQRSSNANLSDDFTAAAGKLIVESLDDLGEREEAAILGNHLSEVRNQRGNASLFHDRTKGTSTVLGFDQWAARELAQLRALVEQTFNGPEVV